MYLVCKNITSSYNKYIETEIRTQLVRPTHFTRNICHMLWFSFEPKTLDAVCIVTALLHNQAIASPATTQHQRAVFTQCLLKFCLAKEQSVLHGDMQTLFEVFINCRYVFVGRHLNFWQSILLLNSIQETEQIFRLTYVQCGGYRIIFFLTARRRYKFIER